MSANLKLKSKKVNRRGISSDNIFDFFNVLLLAIIVFITFYPVYFVVIASISSPQAIINGEVTFLPKGNNFAGFRRVLSDSRLITGYVNSIFYTIVGVAINLSMTLISGYVLSREDFKLRNIIMFFISFTMFFGGGMIPRFIVVKQLKLLDSVWALVLPGAISTWNLIITRTFFQTTIPKELFESASMDGCSNFRFFISIVVPISSSIIVILCLFYGVGHWNSYWSALLYIYDVKKYPLQLVLRDILIRSQISSEMLQTGDTGNIEGNLIASMYEIAESVKYVVIVAACLPIIIVFPFLEKYFIKGVMIGSIKG